MIVSTVAFDVWFYFLLVVILLLLLQLCPCQLTEINDGVLLQ